MTRADRVLYHQIHPLKLATDISACFISGWLCWRHQLLPAALIAFLPSIVCTALLMSFADLDALAAGRFGRYVKINMTWAVVTQRANGQIVMWVAAWQREPILIVLGAAVIVLAWLNGRGVETSQSRPASMARTPRD